MTTPINSDAPLDLARRLSDPIGQRLCAQLREKLLHEATATPTSRTTIAWGRNFLPQHFAKSPSAMHWWLNEQLQKCDDKRGLRINTIGPRGSAKSTIATLAYALRCAVEGREPYIWIVSDTLHQANRHLENIREELLDNLHLAKTYPDAVGKGRIWRQSAITLRNGVTIEGFGTGQRIRGYRRRDARPTLIIGDDLQNDQHMDSARQREHSSRWFHGTLLKAGTKETNVINLATALHHDALAIQLEQTPGWVSRRFQSVIRWPSRDDLWEAWEAIYCDTEESSSGARADDFFLQHREEMLQDSKVLWPEQEDLHSLMRMRVESGHSVFAREKQSSPTAPDACEWPEAYFDDHIWFDRWPADLRMSTLALDPSLGRDSSRGDFSAFVMLGIDASGVVYVEADLARRSTMDTISSGVEHFRCFQPDRFGIEANQFQELLAPQFAAEFERRGMLGIRPWLLHNTTSKQVRIRRLGPLLSSRRLRFLRRSPSTQRLVDQLRQFPLCDHDDGPDALEMAFRLATEIPHIKNDGLGNRLPIG